MTGFSGCDSIKGIFFFLYWLFPHKQLRSPDLSTSFSPNEWHTFTLSFTPNSPLCSLLAISWISILRHVQSAPFIPLGLASVPISFTPWTLNPCPAAVWHCHAALQTFTSHFPQGGEEKEEESWIAEVLGCFFFPAKLSTTRILRNELWFKQ